MSLSSELKETLQTLAQTYETADFLNDDPSRFLRWYSDQADVEAAAFIAAMLSFGSRKQFIPKIQEIFELADAHGGMKCWLMDGNCGGDFRSPLEPFLSGRFQKSPARRIWTSICRRFVTLLSHS